LFYFEDFSSFLLHFTFILTGFLSIVVIRQNTGTWYLWHLREKVGNFKVGGKKGWH